MRFRLYRLMTCWYAFASPLDPPHVAPSSTPLNPPKETDTSPPLDRTVFTTASTVVSPDTLCPASPSHAGVQPPESSTKARLKLRRPVADIAVPMSCGLLSSGMKYAGARKLVLGGGGGLGEPVGDGVLLGLGDGVFVGDGEPVVGPGVGPPPAPGIEKSSAK